MTGAAGQGQSEVTSVMSKQEQGPPTNELEWREELSRAAFFIIYYQSSIPAKKKIYFRWRKSIITSHLCIWAQQPSSSGEWAHNRKIYSILP